MGTKARRLYRSIFLLRMIVGPYLERANMVVKIPIIKHKGA
jgi:hypothetical protein